MAENIFHTKMAKAGSSALIALDYSFAISSILWIFTKRNEILKILIKLSEIDKRFRDFGIKIDYEKQKRKLTMVF